MMSFAINNLIHFERFFFKFPLKTVFIASVCGSDSVEASVEAWNGSGTHFQVSLQAVL